MSYTGPRNYEAELFAAFLANRAPGATDDQRYAASVRAEKIAEQGNLWDRFYDIDEQARLTLYPEGKDWWRVDAGYVP